MVQALRAVALNKASLQDSWGLSSATEHAVRLLRGRAAQYGSYQRQNNPAQKRAMTLKLLCNTLNFTKPNIISIILYCITI